MSASAGWSQRTGTPAARAARRRRAPRTAPSRARRGADHRTHGVGADAGRGCSLCPAATGRRPRPASPPRVGRCPAAPSPGRSDGAPRAPPARGHRSRDSAAVSTATDGRTKSARVRPWLSRHARSLISVPRSRVGVFSAIVRNIRWSSPRCGLTSSAARAARSGFCRTLGVP